MVLAIKPFRFGRQATSGFAIHRIAFALLASHAITAAADKTDKLPPASTKKVDFEEDIVPLLAAHCFKCHGAKKHESNYRLDVKKIALAAADFGEPAIIPGKSAQSPLIHFVAGTDPDVVMPPSGKRLTSKQVGLLRAWIDQGVVWPKELAGDASGGSLKTDHWSLQPVERPKPPEFHDDFVKSPIDAFILARLHESKLRPSKRADKAVLARRIHLVMHGLPPKPRDVDRYVNDHSDTAYQNLVERILKSPRYGERWAQHWIDIVRFGETDGFETNRERPNAWHYRDYIIASLNSDKPYDQFIREQIAGDALAADVATGFLVAGPFDRVKSPDVNLTLMQRQDELADMINTTGTAFLGLTLGCARCHNHKFDPISQKDYYAIQAVFAGINHGDRPLPASADRQQQIDELNRRIERLERRLSRFLALATAGFVAIDDATIADSKTRGLIRFEKPAGQRTNPPGTRRGERDDIGSATRTSNLSGGNYTWWKNKPGEILAAYKTLSSGRFRIWLSWGCGWPTHSTGVEYVLDRDGDLKTSSDQTVLATVDQQKFADKSGEIANRSLWSGFHDAGIHELQGRSLIAIRGGKTGAAVTADTVILEGIDASAPVETVPTKPAVRESVDAKHNIEHIRPVKARFIRFTIHATNNGSQPCIDELELWSGEKNVALSSNGAKATSSSNLPGHEIHKLKHINDGRYGNGRSWISNEPGRGWVQIELPEITAINRIEWARDREGRYADRLATHYVIEVSDEPDQWKRVASSDDRLPPQLTGQAAVSYRFDGFEAAESQQGRVWLAALTKAIEQRDRLSKPMMIYAGTFTQPGPTHRLYRGEPQAKREEVAPDTVRALGSLQLSKTSSEQLRRIKFAEWIADPANPLTSRVMVNRIWQFHFGTGIVDTPSDFGANGTRPSHPRLLDWLAAEFVRSGWSIKHMHRLILMSNAWQQSGRPREDSLAIDAASRLLWRFPPRRLEAEAIRDSILHVSGKLDLTMGGPGFSAFEIEMENVRHFFPKTSYGPSDWRRMVYMTKVRQERDSVFGAFDCPDASQVMPKRTRSTTPLQALSLFNSKFVIQQSKFFAERLKREAGNDLLNQIQRAFRLCTAREPDESELSDSLKFVKTHGLPAFCRALLNSNEFLFIP